MLFLYAGILLRRSGLLVFFLRLMSRILVVELGKAETMSTSTNIHTTRSEPFAVFVFSDSFQNAFPRILNVKFTLIVVIILTIRL